MTMHESDMDEDQTSITSTSTNLSQDDLQDWIGQYNPHKTNKTFRILFHNVNSLKGKDAYTDTIPNLINEQSYLGIDLQCISEHCMNIHHSNTEFKLHQAIHQNTSTTKAIKFTSCQGVHTESEYLPGGTAVILLGPTVGRIIPKGKGGDTMGRWTFLHLRRRSKPPVTIISAYQLVNTNPTNDVGITSWHQQRLFLDQHDRLDDTPRQAFIDDLIEFIKSLQAQQHDIILGGDLNETTTKSTSGILRILTTCDLLDPWTRRFPNLNDFKTNARGSTRIDHVFCSPGLYNHIQAIGYAPFYWITNSDHRAIVIDFDFQALFTSQGHQEDNTAYSKRFIRSNDTKNVIRFINSFHRHLQANNAFGKGDLSSLVPNQIERLDKLITQASESAELKCRKRRPEFFSIALNQLRVKRSVALTHLKLLRQNILDRRTGLHRRLRRYGITMHLSENKKEAYAAYQALNQEVRQQAAQSQQLREEEQRIAINHHEQPNHPSVRRMRGIRKKEATRKTWQIIRHMKLQSGFNQKLDRIDIPESWPDHRLVSTRPNDHHVEDPKICTQWRTVSDPEAIENYVQFRNQLHFGQAQGTPFTIDPLVTDIPWETNNEICDDILQSGAYLVHHDTISSTPQCKALLDSCKAATALDLLPAEITYEQFRSKFMSWDETTSTSPSGRHLGKYKSLFVQITESPTETTPAVFHAPTATTPPQTERKTIQQKQRDIADLILNIVNYCIRTGHILERWKTIINAMIFKETGNFKIHRLRVIHLYEADFNMMLAVKWRQLLHNAITEGTLNEGLFGGRPGCEPQSLTLLEELKYDISFASRRSLFNFDNDASSCYDRIIVSLASLISRKYGIHRKVVAVHAATLQQAKFHLRSQDGLSTTSYSHCLEFPVYGSGQGSANSPCIWLFISSTLCDVHNSIATGASFTSPDGTETVKLSMVGFVDDCTGTVNDFREQEEQALPIIASNMQSDAQAWNDLLWCSGGTLELPKCSYHAISFTFKPDGTPQLVKETTMSTTITITDAATNIPIPIPAKAPHENHKTLGHWKAPYEKNSTTQLKDLINKAQRIGNLIGTGALNRSGTTTAYHAIYIASLKYVLPQCHFSRHQLQVSEAKTMPTIIARCGINRHIARPLRYAPLTYAGCGFIEWHTLQTEGQICLFLKHWRTSTPISKTLRIALAWSQWQTGFSKPILQDTQTPTPHLETRWIRSLRQGLDTISGKILTHHTFTIPTERIGDIHIMDWVCQHIIDLRLTEKDIRIINYCRLYLNVTTVSELFDPTGQFIMDYMYECRRPPWFNRKQYITIQRRPSHYQVRQRWKTLCHAWCSPTTRKRLPTVQLGSWTTTSHPNRPYRQTYYDGTQRLYYHFHEGQYWALKAAHDSITTHSLDRPEPTWQPSTTSTPVAIHRTSLSTGPHLFETPTIPDLITDTSNQDPPNITTTPPSFLPSLQQALDTDPTWTALTKSGQSSLVLYKPNLRSFEALSLSRSPHPTLVISTDSLVSTNNMLCGWSLCTSDGRQLAHHVYTGLGPPSKHRAEAWANVAAATFLHHLTTELRFHSIELAVLVSQKRIATTLQIRSDHKEPFCNTTLTPDWELLEHAMGEYLTATNHTRIHHFSTTTTSSTETFPHTRAIRKNRKILKFLLRQRVNDLQYPQQSTESPFLPQHRCQLILRNQTIDANYCTEIRHAASLPALFGYLRDKHNWDMDTVHNVDWKSFSRAATDFQQSSPQTLMKLVYNQLATQQHKRQAGGQHWLNPNCRNCSDQVPATFDHIIRCQHPAAIKFRAEFPRKIQRFFDRTKPPTQFQQTFLEAIDHSLWGLEPLHSLDNSRSPAVKQAINSLRNQQKRIGWDNLFKGFLGTQWGLHLRSSLSSAPLHKFRLDHITFMSQLIQLMWDSQLTFWREYQEIRHATPTGPDAGTSEARQDLLDAATSLLSSRNEVEPTKRDIYFPIDQERFIDQQSSNGIRNYISNYSRPILMSVKRWKTRATKSIKPLLSYAGFTTASRTQPNTNQGTLVNQATPVDDTPPIIPNPPEADIIGLPTSGTTTTHRHKPTRPQAQRLLTSFWSSRPSNALHQHRQPAQPATRPSSNPISRPSSHFPNHTTAPATTPHHKHFKWRPNSLAQTRLFSSIGRSPSTT